MNPAVCAVCGTTAAQEADRGGPQGAWVQFADHEGAEASGLGHPEGLAYFCAAHRAAAQALAPHPCAEAVALLRAQHPQPRQAPAAPPPAGRRWWQFWRT
ncbi:hypothetical protein M4R22_17310 [Acidovorax sp. GBBC 3334]|uniref:hypothetical protein n=1 Tax=unclassified Acidovorax TaxID=2684926 RepID=UPI0023032A6A|nr:MULTISPECIES: hypothetical protein [unclassified Acidovorax]MDA8456523.1 hypothetical protein [Acidovorax sp. GBBC 3334]MDA8523547.1 hypothetical protein [Acidovorax sp. NCPPB 4044]